MQRASPHESWGLALASYIGCCGLAQTDARCFLRAGCCFLPQVPRASSLGCWGLACPRLVGYLADGGGLAWAAVLAKLRSLRLAKVPAQLQNHGQRKQRQRPRLSSGTTNAKYGDIYNAGKTDRKAAALAPHFRFETSTKPLTVETNAPLRLNRRPPVETHSIIRIIYIISPWGLPQRSALLTR